MFFINLSSLILQQVDMAEWNNEVGSRRESEMVKLEGTRYSAYLHQDTLKTIRHLHSSSLNFPHCTVTGFPNSPFICHIILGGSDWGYQICVVQ